MAIDGLLYGNEKAERTAGCKNTGEYHNLIINKSHGTEKYVMDPLLHFRDRQKQANVVTVKESVVGTEEGPCGVLGACA